MRVTNDTARFYRYIDMTRIVDGLFEFIQETIETELPQEIRFLLIDWLPFWVLRSSFC
jgi:hypothetical protein